MSTFDGKLQEKHLGFIRIDNFERKNYDGMYFCLSHFHTDHCKGLFDEGFAKVLNNGNATVFCSKFTRSLILKMPYCKISATKIFPLELNHSHSLCFQNEDVVLTAVPSGHCPGSVMFLFQSRGMNILYTGDFRISTADISKFRVLHDSSGAPLSLASLYLDTTFCHPNWLEFPSRQQTEEDVLSLVENWLICPNRKVGIWYNSYHGLEFLLIYLARTLKTCIWVMDLKAFDNYSCIPELHDSISNSKGSSRIHLCPVKTQENCGECTIDRLNTKTIKPCAQSFHQKQLQQGRIKENKNVTRVAYSTHCSLKELVGIVNYLSPEKIFPCVVPDNLTSNQVLDNLKLDIDSLSKSLKNEGNESSLSPPRKRMCKEQVFIQESLDPTIISVNPACPAVISPPSPSIIVLNSDEDELKSSSESDTFGFDSPPF